MTAGITAGICSTNALTPEETPHAPEPGRQLETPEEIRKNTPAEEDARNQDLPPTSWKSSGKIVVKAPTSSDTGLDSKGGAILERDPDLDFPVKITAALRVGSGRHMLGNKVSGAREDHNLARFGFKANSFFGGVGIPFSKNPKGPYAFVGRFDGYVGYTNSDDNKGWFLGGLTTNEFPGHHTGAFVHYPINDQITIKPYLVTGWEETINDDNKYLSYGFSARYAPDKKLAVGVAYYGGKEGTTNGPEANKKYGKIGFLKQGITRVDLASAYVQYAMNDKWTYAIGGHYGKAKDPNASKWCGGGLFVYHQYNKNLQLGASFETSAEKGGFVTKSPLPNARANSIAFAAKTAMTKHSNTEAELRYSWADFPAFSNKRSRWDINLVQTYVF